LLLRAKGRTIDPMGLHEDISEATRGDVLDDWIISRNVGRTAEKFGLPTKEVRKLIHDAAIVSRLPETVRIDIHAEVRRLQIAMDTLWPRVLRGELKAIEVWRRLGVSLHALVGWVAPANSGFHLSVNSVTVTTGSAKLEQLLDSLMALPPPQANNSQANNEAEGDSPN
jgi:hypothetical protein